MKRDVIVACDFKDRQDTMEFLKKFNDVKPYLKIGMELFYGCGPDIVREAKAMGHKVFLDLKLHDIPNTVKKAMKNLAVLGADMVNLHAAGTIEMMTAALEGLEAGTAAGKERPLLIAVTQLTSTSQERMQNQLLINATIEECVAQYAKNAKIAGLDGVVCSPLEAGLVKTACGNEFLTVTPGIRFADDSKDDQVRITTPAKAKDIGTDFIVVGRSITAAQDPVAAYNRALKDFI